MATGKQRAWGGSETETPSIVRARGKPSATETLQTLVQISLALSKAGYDVTNKQFTLCLIGIVQGGSQTDRADALLALLEHLHITQTEEI